MNPVWLVLCHYTPGELITPPVMRTWIDEAIENANITIGASQQTVDLNQTAGNMKLNGVPNQSLSEQVSFLWNQK